MTTSVRQIVGYAAVSPASGVSVREVVAYSWERPKGTVGLRSVTGYAWRLNVAPLPLGKTGQLALLDLINEVTDVTFTIGTGTYPLVFGALTADASVLNTNTALSLTCPSKYSGSISVHYNRQLLTRAFPNAATTPLFSIPSATTIRALVPQINSTFGVHLVATDLVDGPVSAGATQITIAAASTSYMFTPASTQVLGTS